MKRIIIVGIIGFVALWVGIAGAEPERDAAPTTPPAVQQECRDALNADPAFAKLIADKLNIRVEQKIVDAHEDAYHHIQKNEAHVIYAYAAMWIVAALFVLFLFLRQQKLEAEIAGLRRDLEVAAKDPAKEPT